MDERTQVYYARRAAEVAERYARCEGGVGRYSGRAFGRGWRVLDVGAGPGREMAGLLAMGVDASGVEPCAELRAEAVARYPELKGRLRAGGSGGSGSRSGAGSTACSARRC